MMDEIYSLLCSLLLFYSAIICTDGQVIPDCPDRGETLCIGHNNMKPNAEGGNVADILKDAHDQFCGCRYIHGNLYINILPTFDGASEPLVEGNFSFLYHIKEISGFLALTGIPPIPRLSLPNLRVIRGITTLPVSNKDYSLAVLGKIYSLYMPKLTEISTGDVILRGDPSTPSLCNVNSINWNDIISSSSTIPTITPMGCTPNDVLNCTMLGCGNCWCNDSVNECCQIITADCDGSCSSTGRCQRIGNSRAIQCCHSECIAGCTSGNPNECLACRNVLDDGFCREKCDDRRTIFDRDSRAVIDNPNFRFQASPLCLRTCPADFFELDALCVEECPTNFMTAGNGSRACIDCNGVCPLECTANRAFTDVFTGCTILLGSLSIGPVPADRSVSELEQLRTIREIRGSLTINNFDGTDLPYLSNLEVVGSGSPQRLSCGNDLFPIALSIKDATSLVSIDLSSLQRIEGGGIRMDNNPQLCYVGNLSYYLTNSSFGSCLIGNFMQYRNECLAANLTCHPECLASQGWCWGPNDTQCVTCKNFLYEGQCVPICNNFTTFGIHLHGMNADRVCQPCHQFCNGSCNGEGPDQCDQCNTDFFVSVSTGTGVDCLESCIVGTYLPSNVLAGECLPCFEGCDATHGCAGPGRTFNSTNGCLNCSTVILNRNEDQVQCQRDRAVCPSGHYREQLSTQYEIFPPPTVLCHQCHELCDTCQGPGVDNCLECAFVASSNGTCAFSCDSTTEMLSSVDSKRCDLILPALGAGGIAGIVIVVIVFALLGLSLLVISIICVTRLFRNSKAVNIKNDIFDSPEELEMFTLGKETLQPPKMAPNNARLIVAPKDELEFGNELGAGAFGTVYEGYWQPDHNKYHVAIKVLKNAAPSANTELLQEGAVMASLDHDNVVRLYCVCMSKQLMLVSQFVPLGSLLDYLKKHKEKLNGYTILLFSSQIAKGMAYLESKHLVHRDLAARNVLIQTPVKVKITDFGLTRIVESDQAHYEASSSKMPVRWLPPESIRQRVFNHKTDVWSYGVTIWEILTFGARPYQGMKPYDILKMLESGRRLEQPLTSTIELYLVLLQCWILEPDGRPSFNDLVARFQEMVSDPSRYVLTVLDGSASDYGALPSNIHREGDEAYEQPFTNETLPANASLPGTLPSTDSVSPYSSAATPYYMAQEITNKDKNIQDYEVPIESPPAYNGVNPRYVDLSSTTLKKPVEKVPSYDYIDEKRLLLQSDNQLQTSPYELPVDGVFNDNYELPEPQPSLNVNTDYEVPEDSNSVHSYEDLNEGMNEEIPLINEVYDVAPTAVSNNYEDIEDQTTTVQDSFMNMTYDSNAGLLGNESGKSGTIPSSFANMMYDSRSGTVGNTIPPANDSNYEDIEDDSGAAPSSFANMMYDSRSGTVGNTIPPANDSNYEDIEDDSGAVPSSFANMMYDSRSGTVDNTNPPANDSNYEDIEDDSGAVPSSFANMMYDSRSGTVDNTNPPANDSNYEDIEDDSGAVPSSFANMMYDSHAGTVGNTIAPNNYEDIDDELPPNTFSNMLYDSYPQGPDRLPHSPPLPRVASPYEIPVTDGDYELPTDGMPRVPQSNVYEAPIDY